MSLAGHGIRLSLRHSAFPPLPVTLDLSSGLRRRSCIAPIVALSMGAPPSARRVGVKGGMGKG